MNLLLGEIQSFIRKQINEDKAKNLLDFLSNKPFVNKKSKSFLFHGTSIHPDEFELRDDYDFEDSNTWSGDLPYGCLFLTTSLEEARAYGRYIIPCELKSYKAKTFKTYTRNPSQVFDRDYGIDLYRNDEDYDFWNKFENSGKPVLEIIGLDRSTIITYIENVIPRTDLASEFYS